MGTPPNTGRYPDYDGKYDPRSDQLWVGYILSEFEQIETADGIKLVGDCPRCGDQMDAFVQTEPEAGNFGFETFESVVVECNCRGEHENRAADQHGCGIYGKIDAQQ